MEYERRIFITRCYRNFWVRKLVSGCLQLQSRLHIVLHRNQQSNVESVLADLVFDKLQHLFLFAVNKNILLMNTLYLLCHCFQSVHNLDTKRTCTLVWSLTHICISKTKNVYTLKGWYNISFWKSKFIDLAYHTPMCDKHCILGAFRVLRKKNPQANYLGGIRTHGYLPHSRADVLTTRPPSTPGWFRIPPE